MKTYIVTYGQGKTLHKAVVQAKSREEIRIKAAERRLAVTEIKEKEDTSFFRSSSILTDKECAFLFGQTGLLLKAGIPLTEAWHLISRRLKNRRKRQAVEGCITAMESGKRAAESMQDSGAFPQTACSLVQAGEHSGHMEDMTELLASYYERLCDERSQLRNMMIYPTFLFVCINILFFGALVFVIPVFSDLFAETGVPLPQSTRMLLAAGNFLCRYGPFLIGAAVMTGILIYKLLQRRRYREKIEELLWRIGRIRIFFLIWSWQRFSMILAVQLAGGIPIISALGDALSAVPSEVFKGHIVRTIRCLENGMSFSTAVKSGRFGTSYVETMLRVGESTGEYDRVLRTVSAYYGKRLRETSTAIRKAAEPLMLVLTGIVTGFLVTALLLPLLDMITAVN